MAMSLDKKTVAVVRKSNVLFVELEPNDPAGLQVYQLGAHHPQVALHPQRDWLASRTQGSNVVHLWNLSDPGPELDSTVVPGSAYFTFSPDGQWLATCWSGEFRFYRVGEWREPAFVVRRMFATDQHAPVAFSRDGRTVALAASRYSIQLHKLPAAGRGQTSLIATLESPDRLPLEILAFSPDGTHLAAAADGKVIFLWNLAALGQGLASLGLHGDWPVPP